MPFDLSDEYVVLASMYQVFGEEISEAFAAADREASATIARARAEIVSLKKQLNG